MPRPAKAPDEGFEIVLLVDVWFPDAATGETKPFPRGTLRVVDAELRDRLCGNGAAVAVLR